MRMVSSLGFLILLAAVPACGSAAKVSDTGYRGTWSRGFGPGLSTIAIWTEGEQAKFRWSLRTEDGTWVVQCNWEGHCEEFEGPKKVSDYQFRAWVNPETQRVMVEVKREILAGDNKGTRTQWTDELRVEEGGLKLTAETVERDGRKFEPGAGPIYQFEKVADEVADPPQSTGLEHGAGRSGGDS